MTDKLDFEQMDHIAEARHTATSDSIRLKAPNPYGEENSLERLAYLARFYEARLHRRIAQAHAAAHQQQASKPRKANP